MSEEDDVAAWIKGPESIKKDEVHSQLAAAASKMVKDSCVNGIVELGANVNSGHKAECMIKAVQAGMKDVTVKVLASSQVTDVSLMGFKDTSTNVTDSSNGDQDARRICEENCHIMAADKGDILNTGTVWGAHGLQTQSCVPVGKQLVQVVQVSLSHNHYRMRVAALKAIRRLVMCGAHDAIYELTAYRDPNLIPIKCFYELDPKTHYFAVLATDRNSSAREELYLLAGFQDPSPHLRELALKLIEEVGLQYEEENEKEVKDTHTYLTEDIDDIVSLTGAPLPHPFTRRPCLGARIMVKSVTAIILHAIAGFRGVNEGVIAVADQLIRAWHLDNAAKK
ncbi:unnamed protein product [Sphagnum compactum]